MVRETLGDNAVIVAAGDEVRGKSVRVVAAIEPAFEFGKQNAGEGWLQYDSEQDTDAVAEEITDALLRHGASEDVMDHIVSCVTVMALEDTGTALVEALAQLYKFQPLPTKQERRPIILVGAPGAGKTLAAAKMAARGAMSGLSIGVISTDTVRAGGLEQLKAFTDLLDIDLYKAGTPQDLSHAVNDLHGEADQIIIDTCGLNPFNTDDIRTLAKMIGAAEASPVMVLPGGIDADEAGEMGRVFAALGAVRLLPTRVDIARRLGGLLGAAHQGNLAFSDVSNTAKVAQGLAPLSPKALARILLPSAFRTQGIPARESTQNQHTPTQKPSRSNQNAKTSAPLSRLQKTGSKQ